MKKNGLQNTAITAFILLIALPILVTNLLLGMSYKKTLHGNYAMQIEKSNVQFKAGIDDEIKRLALALSVVANDKDLMNLLEQWNNAITSYERYAISSTIDRQLNYVFSFNSDVNGIVVFYKNGNHFYFRNDLSTPVSEMKELPWYKASENKKGHVSLVGTNGNYLYTKTKKKNWDAVITPKTITLDNHIERIYISMNSTLLNGLKSIETNHRSILLLDQNDQVILDAINPKADKGQSLVNLFHRTAVEKNTKDHQRVNQTYYMSKLPLNHQNWQLLFVEPIDEITKDVKKLLSSFYLIYLIIALSFSTYIIIFYLTSIRPVRQLVEKMQTVEAGNLQVTSEIRGPQEIKRLNATFNQMMHNINHLIVERDQKEKERSIEEIKALQAQINPHFLYNTLNTIKLMAMMTKAHGIQKMLDSFMKVIELTYKSEGSLLSIDEEIVYLDAYLYIMKARYGSFFEVEYQVSDNVKQYKIMKMLIQPFIENAVVHGLQFRQGGIIRLSIYQSEQQLMVEVYDNGMGMDENQLNNLFNRHGDSMNHIGIVNVKSRIALTYGEAYSVKVVSSIGEFTKITMNLPLIPREGDTCV